MTFRWALAVGLGALTGFLASLAGWQINLVAIHRGLHRGRTATFLVGLGSTCADLAFMLTAFVGVIPLSRFPELWMRLKWFGIALIFFAAGRIFFQKSPEEEKKKKKGKRNPAKSFLLGFLLVISNPFIFLLWIGVISFLVSHFPDAQIFRFHSFFLMSFLAGGAVWFTFLSQVVLHGARKWGAHRLRFLSKISALALIAAGIFLMVERF